MKKTFLILSSVFVLANLSNLQASESNALDEDRNKVKPPANTKPLPKFNPGTPDYEKFCEERKLKYELEEKKRIYKPLENTDYLPSTPVPVSSQFYERTNFTKFYPVAFKQPDTNSDKTIAPLLQEENNINPSHPKVQSSAPAHNIIIPDDLLKGLVLALNDLDAVVPKLRGEDVHIFNKMFVTQHRNLVLDCNTIIGCMKTLTPETVFNQINQMRTSELLSVGTDFDPAVQKLTTHLKSYSMDIETGLNVPELLSSTWQLAQQVDKQVSNPNSSCCLQVRW